MGKHSVKRSVRHKTGYAFTGLATAGAVALVVLAANTAHADPGADWIGTAKCESGGRWNINTGNSYYGGLQFAQATWVGFGGQQYAARADLATPAQQVAIAEKVLAKQGPGAWPVCFRRGSSAPAATSPGPVAAGSYTVRAGDTLVNIAGANGTTWQQLAQLNHVPNPDLILVGQQLRLR